MSELNEWILKYTSGELSRLMTRFWLFFVMVLAVTAGWYFLVRRHSTGEVYLHRKLADLKGHYILLLGLIAYAVICFIRTDGWALKAAIVILTGISVFYLFRLTRFGVITSLFTLWAESAAVLVPHLARICSCAA